MPSGGDDNDSGNIGDENKRHNVQSSGDDQDNDDNHKESDERNSEDAKVLEAHGDTMRASVCIDMCTDMCIDICTGQRPWQELWAPVCIDMCT